MAARDSGGLGDFERLILQQAVTVVALELMRQRAMRDTERRLAGDVLAEALTGRLSEEELAMRLRPFGIGQSAAVLVFVERRRRRRRRRRPRPSSTASSADAGVGALVATRERLLCAVVDAREGVDPVALAGRAREALAERRRELRAARVARGAGGRAAAHASTRRAARSRRPRSPTASSPPVASYRDLGAFQLLLSLQDDDALRLYCDSVLGPLEDASGEYGDELIRSLEAFIEQNGQWERAARELYCHRHTLRYRIRRVEQLTGRDLSKRARPDRVLAGAAGARAGEHEREDRDTNEGRRSDGDQDGRVPRVAHARGRAGSWSSTGTRC